MSIGVEGAKDGEQILWGAPTYDQVMIGWNETLHACGGYADFKLSRMTMEMPGGGRIIYRSLADPNNARGHTADKVLIDEAGDVSQIAWYEVLRAMLMDTGGDAWFVGTPRGRNWFWREWLAAQERDDAVSWQAPTVGCRVEDGLLIREHHPLENPDLPFAEIQQIFDTTPIDIFKQEYLAQFLENEGAVFRNILACLHAPFNEPVGKHRHHTVVMGVDWAKQADYTCLSVVCKECKQELALERFNKISYNYQRERLKSLAEHWRVKQILAESNSIGEPNIDALRADGLPVIGFTTTASSKPPLIESLALAFEREEVQWLDIPVATGELEAYERKVSQTTGRSQYSAPEGLHDDTVIARALANKARLEGGTFARAIVY